MVNGKIFVTKYDGSREHYDQGKVVNSLLRSGIKKNELTMVLSNVEAKLYDGITTRELYEIVNQCLFGLSSPIVLSAYRLRENLSKMDSLVFEQFVKKILEKEGYICQWNVIVKGECIEHQIDVVAKKQDSLYLVEVKRHQNYHRDCGLGTVIELWARLDDIQKGYKKGINDFNFSKAWLFSNTKFSEHALTYATAKGIKLTGWRYGSDGKGLEEMIQNAGINEVNRLVSKLPQNLPMGLATREEAL
ncbi:MAG: restriction endonuclease [bacterium]|nr:restriction endonuclease [bacterium]